MVRELKVEAGHSMRLVRDEVSDLPKRGSRANLASLLDFVDLVLQLCDPPELHVKIAPHLVHDLTALVQQVDDVVKFLTCDGDSSCLRDTWESAGSPAAGRHWVIGSPSVSYC